MADKPWRDEETLRELFHDECLKTGEVAERLGVHEWTIRKWTDKLGVSREPWEDEERLRKLYHEDGLSVQEVADRLNCSNNTIHKAFDEFGIETRSFGEHQTPDKLKNEDWLREIHHDKRLTVTEIADKVGCAPKTVQNAFDRHGIENWRSNKVGEDAKEVLQDKDQLRRLYYDEKMSTVDISDTIGVNQSTVWNWFDRHGIETRDRSELVGELHPRYNPESDQHVYDKKWRKVREKVIQRDGEQCVECGVDRDEWIEESGMDLDVHHIIPQHKCEDKYDKDNLITMCRSCHTREEQTND